MKKMIRMAPCNTNNIEKTHQKGGFLHGVQVHLPDVLIQVGKKRIIPKGNHNIP